MKNHMLLVAGAVALFACSDTTGPEGAALENDSTMHRVSIAAQPASHGFVTHHIDQKSSGEFAILGWCDEAGGVVRAAAPGTGTMTHIGRFEIEESGCIDLATGLISDGLAILTAANGDEIHLDYFGRIVPGAEPQTMELTYVATGGTGRFASAESQVEIVVIYTSETEWVSYGGGWIRYAASDRSDR